MVNMRLSIAVAFVAGLALASADAVAQCYFTAGQKALNSYVPCTGGNGHVSCCLAGDFCLADGACYGPETQMTYIAGCTDPTYKDGSCKGGSDTCNKQTQFQGLAVCGNSWVCCGGRGQQGVVPSNDYADTCPCDEGYATAIFNAGTSLAAQHSLPTNIPTSRTSPATSTSASSAASSQTSKTSPSSNSASVSSAAATTTSESSSSSAAATTIPLSQSGGIHGTGAGSAPAAQTSAGATVTSQPDNKSLKIGLGVGIPLAIALLAAIAVAAFCFRRRMRGTPGYVSQADMSTAVWQGEVAGSGLPAAELGAYNASGGGWKQNPGSSNGYTPMRENQPTPPPQYKFGGEESSLHRPESQGILQANRNG